MKIRAYKVEDLFTVVSMLSAIVGAAGAELRGLFKPTDIVSTGKEFSEDEAEEQGIKVVMFILGKCYTECAPLLIKWFASLCSMSEQEFLDQPPETVLDIIDDLATRKESKDFFSRAYQLYKKINGIGSTTKTASAKS